MIYENGLATIAKSCKFMKSETGERWTLVHLLEQGLKPYFWLDYIPDHPQADAIFGHHEEGFLSCMFMKIDRDRLRHGAGDACITHVHTHDDKLLVLEPPYHFPIDKLRFSATDIKRLCLDLPKRELLSVGW